MLRSAPSTLLSRRTISKKFWPGKFFRILTWILILSLFTPLFQPPVQAVAAPTPLSPQDNSYVTITGYSPGGYSSYITAPPLAIPQFSWTAVAGTKNYRLQFSQNIGFSPVALEITTPNTSYTPINAEKFPEGNLYWRVRVDSPVASNYSSPVLFVKDWASPDNAPLLVSPGNAAQVDFYDSPSFSWSPVKGASRYRFQIAASEGGFGAPIYNQVTLATSHQPISKLNNGIYYWRVIPLDPYDREGTISEVRSFNLSYGSQAAFPLEVPAMLEPTDESFPTFTPTFLWTAVRGAQYYRLEYTTDPTCDFGVAGYNTFVETRNTTYTPTSAFPNDVNYCWRVRAHSDKSISDWSAVWEFEKKWYIQPVLLTPTNLYQYVAMPYFSWTPVPGAARYKIEVNLENAFPPTGGGNCRFTDYSANTHYIHLKTPVCIPAAGQTYHWRVTPIDRSSNEGKPSNVSSFVGGSDSPQLIYPLYYYSYPPQSYPAGSDLYPLEDRSVAFPLFMWHRLTEYNPYVSQQFAAYRVEVNAGNPFLDAADWTAETENLSAAPTAANPFPAINPSTDYYWRVCPLASLGGGTLGHCSQVWKTRFNTDQVLPAASSVTLLRPVHGYEFAETAPLLEWKPVTGADSYEVEISIDPGFDVGDVVNSAVVPYTAYTPQQRLDYYPSTPDSDLDYGTYYWRVRARSGGNPIGSWSSAWRFEVTAQSNWRESRVLGNLPADNRLIAYDPTGDVNASYDLTNLYAAESGGINQVFWYIGFTAPAAGDNNAYVLYIDLDHQDNSGAAGDAKGYSASFTAGHLPEYALYIHPAGGVFSASNVHIYPFDGSVWDFPVILGDVGGEVYENASYVELKIPAAAIKMEAETGSASVALVSIDESTGAIQDTVPSGSYPTLDRFSAVSGRLTLVNPPSNLTGDPTTLPSILAMSWHLPVDVPWWGFNIQVGVDPSLTSWLYNTKIWNAANIFTEYTSNSLSDYEFKGDNTYYWRVRPLYYSAPAPDQNIAGAWSRVGRFERQGFIPQDLRESVTFATPTFSWEMVEGSDGYDIQVDNDPNFGSPEFGTITTAQTSYTPLNALANGTYYWRVRARRYNSVTNDWSSADAFTLSLPKPTGLTPNQSDPKQAFASAPTLCWDPILHQQDSRAVLSAWKYRVQVSKDSAFGSIYDSVDSTEQNCWTPTKGYEDGTYYWRVAMIDGNSHLGDYSSPAQFTKQYPTTTLVSPLNGAQSEGTPTFVWEPVNGATSYKLEISLYQTFGVIYESAVTNNTRYTPTKSYDNLTYYWRVAIVDKDGKTGPFNDAVIIVGSAPPANSSGSLFIPLISK